MICCHVDDFLHAGDEHFEILMEKCVKDFLMEKLKRKHLNT